MVERQEHHWHVLVAYIPQFQFDHIAMQQPAILSTLNPDCMNPLYRYTSHKNIQWICTTCIQSAYLGLYSGWNWETVFQDASSLEYPNHYLLKGPDGHVDTTSFSQNFSVSDWSSNTVSIGSTSNNNVDMKDAEPAYATHYPDYNVFSKGLLVNNGYVERGVSDFTPYLSTPTNTPYLSMLSPIESTMFRILSLPD
ncbi:uncharacterized protein LACBIDRAFT_331141 [Laccaria bicolor S238N-H82]|uniref:Predicted protein n=1 Tax=Laccaria bicolor (strain S238N-H82 / ATCC MYA-4686) TaxID=486041 RepID=B0DNL2_LACBS|nr:uncharacterized protein LACBIDRAFT_331141 [Laccaria bicolor S238N-H82]EDR03676.1 predicted protein [Laccaria bicolor S238N-H82]|eukprot:XP_001885529.1 predicted protein [Laccaria bicolor S238N-H82]